MQNLSELEKIAIQAATTQAAPDWLSLYKLSHPDSHANDLRAIVSRWKNSLRVQEYYRQVRTWIDDRIKEETDRAREEERRKLESLKREAAGIESGLIDYSDPAQQRRKLNELVNQADDSREALDALKTIIATQKDDRDGARERKQVQAFLPVRCKSCPLYLQQAEKLNSIK